MSTTCTGMESLHGVQVLVESATKTYEMRDGEDLFASTGSISRSRRENLSQWWAPRAEEHLLSMIAGLSPAHRSNSDRRQEVRRPHPKVGVVFQSDLLLYWRNIVDNILLPVEIKGWKRQSYLARVDMLLDQVGLSGFGEKFPSELSGGMRQRVAICRALVQEPGLLLMDEPFGALDALTREQMIADLQSMWCRVNNTVMFITHSIEEAVFLADRVLVMSPRPGRIDLDRHIEIRRPRSWKDRIEPKFIAYMTEIREIFESRGVLAPA